MELQHIPEDDIIDVIEMSEKIQSSTYDILNDMDIDLAMVTLMTAATNCILTQCDDLEEFVFYRNIFVQILDNIILKWEQR